MPLSTVRKIHCRNSCGSEGRRASCSLLALRSSRRITFFKKGAPGCRLPERAHGSQESRKRFVACRSRYERITRAELENIVKRVNCMSRTRVLIGVCAICLLWVSFGPDAARASGETRPGAYSARQGGLPGWQNAPSTFGGVSKNLEGATPARIAQQEGQVSAKNPRPSIPQQSSRSSTQEYHVWLERCWKGGGTIAMAFPPQSILPSYFNPHWTRVSMRFCAAVQQPESQ